MNAVALKGEARWGWKSPNITLRPLQVGDLGWITHRQAVLYARGYGWDWRYEGLVGGIMSRFAAAFDPAREDAWVASMTAPSPARSS